MYKIRNRRKKYKYRLVTRSGKLIAESDSRQYLVNICLKSKNSEIANAIIYVNN